MPSHHQLYSSLSIDLKFIHFSKGFLKVRTELSDLKILVTVRPTHTCTSTCKTIFKLSHFKVQCMCQMDRK